MDDGNSDNSSASSKSSKETVFCIDIKSGLKLPMEEVELGGQEFDDDTSGESEPKR
jgi:hypothetical protein